MALKVRSYIPCDNPCWAVPKIQTVASHAPQGYLSSLEHLGLFQDQSLIKSLPRIENDIRNPSWKRLKVKLRKIDFVWWWCREATYSLCKFGDETHEIPSITNGFFIVGEYQVIPHHEELEEHKVTLFYFLFDMNEDLRGHAKHQNRALPWEGFHKQRRERGGGMPRHAKIQEA